MRVIGFRLYSHLSIITQQLSNQVNSMFVQRSRNVGQRREPMNYIGILESTEKQIKHGRFRKNHPEDFAIIFPTTTSIYNGELTSLFIVVGSDVSYYVSKEVGTAIQLYPNVLSFQAMKQHLEMILSEKCVISYENNGFGIRAVQQHFGIDKELIEKAQKHDVIGKLRGLKIKQRGEPYTRQSMLEKQGLGNDQIKALKAQNIVQLWYCRYHSKTHLNLLLAWAMMNALAIKYLAIMALWTCQHKFKREVLNWREILLERKSENASILLHFMESELKLDLSSEEAQAILAKM